MAEQKDQNEKTRKLGERQFNMWRKEEEKSQGVRCKGNNSWPPTIGPVAMPPLPHQKKPSLQLLFQTFYVMEYPCWPVCARCAGCALSKLSAHWRGRARREKALMLCTHCSAMTRTAVLPTLFQSHPKPGMLRRKLPPPQPDSVHCQMYMKAQRPTFIS